MKKSDLIKMFREGIFDTSIKIRKHYLEKQFDMSLFSVFYKEDYIILINSHPQIILKEEHMKDIEFTITKSEYNDLVTLYKVGTK